MFHAELQRHELSNLVFSCFPIEFHKALLDMCDMLH